ncbi:lipopolysaccharide assembly protein LapA domain-containing protein [Lysobacter panacisoli]|uniref:Lipopolysaccharide assembly protein A domain-containing protein n=1 Tax=Lysobacter panacisoli TaxID=1255263 RepID=A0ABP9L804_9GAMM|nr:lipopolysaccharide assembly protein LapA domain-containing protein [Lysobacter panacisoli]
MRLLRFLIAIACLSAGAIIGALNRAPVMVDLGFARMPSNLGVSLLVALLLGVLVGGLAISASVVLPLRRRLARAERQLPVAAPPSGT